MRDTTKGTLAILTAFVWWGLSPLFYKALAHIPATEILVHRTLWSAILFCAVLAVQGRPRAPFEALSQAADRRTIALAALMVGCNWFLFIYSVQVGKALEASLGYFIYPLITVLSPLAVAVFLWFIWQGQSAFGQSAYDTLMLILCGPMTAGPLILFAYAARRIRLSSVGLLSYLNPSLQFLVAVLIFMEPVTQWHAVAFPIIWIALALYSVAEWRQDKAERSADSNS